MYAGNIINNDIVPSPTTRHSIDPATGSALYEVPVARQEDVDAAVQAARRALKSWSTTPCSGHAKLLLKYADLLEENRDEMERLLTLEQGRPLSLSSTEVTCALVWLRAFATMEIEDEVLQDDDEKTIYSTHPPIGVCAGIVSELVSNCS
jgi:acyl-CoA reductase-like NAD-dependent aldehyde dehydrogenase